MTYAILVSAILVDLRSNLFLSIERSNPDLSFLGQDSQIGGVGQEGKGIFA